MKHMPSLRLAPLMVLLGSLVWLACGDDDNASPQNTEPLITDVGTPVGDATSASIGAAGGSLQSADGRIKLTVPVGALTAATTVSIQPISNEAPLGMGNGYRLLPEGTAFAKPVELSFQYDEDLLNGVAEDFLWVVTQADDGSWNAVLKSTVNADNHTVTVETTHFSDWSLGRFIDLSLTPSSSTLLVGKTQQLKITGFAASGATEDDLVALAPVVDLDQELVPLTPIRPLENRLQDFRVKSWTLNGSSAPVSNNNGSLTASDFSATFVAPNKKPNPSMVAVSAQLEGNDVKGNKTMYMVTSNISIISSDYYLLVTIDGQTYEYYQYGFNGSIPPDPENFAIANCGRDDDGMLEFGGGTYVNGSTLKDMFAVFLENPHEGSITMGCHNSEDENNDDDAVEFGLGNNATHYKLDYVQRTKNKDVCDYTYKCGNFSISLLEYEDKAMSDVSGFFSGTLYEDLPSNSNNCKTPETHSVKGEFRLVMVN
jgi:hypothetical protein